MLVVVALALNQFSNLTAWQFGCLGLVMACALGLMLLSLRDWLSTYDRLLASESRGGAR